ncbi:MAG TPA: hypothetical protein PKA10_06965 [Selenomonadales bacterium]|nr:hypothetical protein [Selenomonadales bacterium]
MAKARFSPLRQRRVRRFGRTQTGPADWDGPVFEPSDDAGRD